MSFKNKIRANGLYEQIGDYKQFDDNGIPLWKAYHGMDTIISYIRDHVDPSREGYNTYLVLAIVKGPEQVIHQFRGC